MVSNSFRKILIKIYALAILVVNFAIMLWMFKVFTVPFIESFKDWQRGLWLSPYLGILAAIIILIDYKSPLLNGIYSYLFLFPLIAFFQSFGDPISLFSHSIHFLGFYILSPKTHDIYISRKGLGDGFIAIGLWLILCWLLQFNYDGMGANANNISDKLFPLILVGAVIWLLIVRHFWGRKAKVQGVYQYRHTMLGSDWPTPPAIVVFGITISVLCLFYYIHILINKDYFGFLELIPIVGIITAICIFYNWNNLHLNAVVWVLFPLTFVSVNLNNIFLFLIWITLFSIPIFSYYYRVKITWNGVYLGFGSWIFLILLTASLLYHFGDISRSINQVTSISLFITYIAAILWFILLRSRSIDYFDETPFALLFLPKYIKEIQLFKKFNEIPNGKPEKK